MFTPVPYYNPISVMARGYGPITVSIVNEGRQFQFCMSDKKMQLHYNRVGGTAGMEEMRSACKILAEDVNRYNIDFILEQAWGRFADVPINADEEIEEEFIIDDTWRFPVGTDRFEVWHFFDEQHSRGIEHLLYHVAAN